MLIIHHILQNFMFFKKLCKKSDNVINSFGGVSMERRKYLGHYDDLYLDAALMPDGFFLIEFLTLTGGDTTT